MVAKEMGQPIGGYLGRWRLLLGRCVHASIGVMR